MSNDTANRIYDVLVTTCGAREDAREYFTRWFTDSRNSREFRFIGNLGFGGKFWNNNNSFYVNCYPEDETEDLKAIIYNANAELAVIYAEQG
jgi:hypothetical protein